MHYIADKLFDPLFAQKVYQLFLIASIFVFVVGVGLLSRNTTALRFMNFMNNWVSTRKLTKPVTVPHFIEPVLLKQPTYLGLFIILGSITSLFVLKDIDADVFRDALLYFGTSSNFALAFAIPIRWFLLVGNGVCGIVGLLIIFSPRLFLAFEAYSDKWYTLRKATYPLEKVHNELDSWVSKNPSVSGIILIASSLGLAATMYVHLSFK